MNSPRNTQMDTQEGGVSKSDQRRRAALKNTDKNTAPEKGFFFPIQQIFVAADTQEEAVEKLATIISQPK